MQFYNKINWIFTKTLKHSRTLTYIYTSNTHPHIPKYTHVYPQIHTYPYAHTDRFHRQQRRGVFRWYRYWRRIRYHGNLSPRILEVSPIGGHTGCSAYEQYHDHKPRPSAPQIAGTTRIIKDVFFSIFYNILNKVN